MPKSKSPRPPRAVPPITGTAAQKDKARDDRLASLEARLARLENDDDVRIAAAAALRKP